ncbi:hypothetical protein P3342_009168 [Pyrenophora teres f. teres]|nr:hypothetical protein P3342_009168 [Pyrenophora teres f. teres]
MEQNITSEGLFRVPPHSRLRDSLKEAYDRGQKYIIWKDNEVTLPVPPYAHAEHQDEIIAEVFPTDAYSVYMAAAMIKAWYASLRQPIFPTESYRDLRRLYGDSQEVLELEKLTDLFSPTSEWSLLPGQSREILCRHLLPLMSAISARREQNKMNAENLAVCFAPGLLCGPDQLEDAKMSSIIRRIFTQAVKMWSEGLREACGQTEDAFYEGLKLPYNEHDWEDPPDATRDSMDSDESLEDQISGITLLDNEKLPTFREPRREQRDELPPPLPPRSRAPSTKSSTDSIQRKPAPPLAVPPRYSAVISDAPEDVAESPITYAATTDGFSPRRNDENSMGKAPVVPPRWNGPSDEKKSAHGWYGTSWAHSAVSAPATEPAFRRPSIPFSATTPPSRSPSINSLARPVYPKAPQVPIIKHPAPPTATTLPVPTAAPRPRMPSPGLMQRMPSFEQFGAKDQSNKTADGDQESGVDTGKTLKPKKMNLKKQSVEDLRRLYEERAGTASVLVQAGKQRNA